MQATAQEAQLRGPSGQKKPIAETDRSRRMGSSAARFKESPHLLRKVLGSAGPKTLNVVH